MYRRYSLLNSGNHLPWWFRCPPLTDFQVPTLQILCDVAKVLNEGGITSCSSRQIFYTWLLKYSNLSCDFTCLLFLQLQPGGIKVISSNVSKRPFPKNRLCSKSSNYVHLYLQCYTLVIVEILNRSLQERKEKKEKKNSSQVPISWVHAGFQEQISLRFLCSKETFSSSPWNLQML